MFEGLFSPVHILVILVVALVVLGPGKLPEVGRHIGKASREYRRFHHLVNDPVRSILAQEAQRPAPPPAHAAPPVTDAAPPTTPGPTPPDLPEHLDPSTT